MIWSSSLQSLQYLVFTLLKIYITIIDSIMLNISNPGVLSGANVTVLYSVFIFPALSTATIVILFAPFDNVSVALQLIVPAFNPFTVTTKISFGLCAVPDIVNLSETTTSGIGLSLIHISEPTRLG